MTITARQDLIVTKIVAGLFADMSNDRYRGPNFRWARFHEMAADWAVSNFGLYFREGYKYNENKIRKHAESYAKELVGRAGYTDGN